MGQCFCGKQPATSDRSEAQTENLESPAPSARQELREFSYTALATATENFTEGSVIGRGRSGPVYRGRLVTGQIIAVRRLKDTTSDIEQFRLEVDMLSLLHHRNIIDVIGYCAADNMRFVVYEFIHLGSAEAYLYGDKILAWDMRLRIASGVAKGLSFLHREAPPIVYGRLKLSNVLLDVGLHPKLSDVGLERLDDELELDATSLGYDVPEYPRSGALTTKSDVYCFGVILFQLLTGKRPDVIVERENGTITLAKEWVANSPDSLYRLLHAQIRNDFGLRYLMRLTEVALMCVEDDPKVRPDMDEVAQFLVAFTVWVRAGRHMPRSPDRPRRGGASLSAARANYEGGESSSSDAQATSERGVFHTSERMPPRPPGAV